MMMFGRRMAAAEKAKELQALHVKRLRAQGERKLDDKIAQEKAMLKTAKESERSKKVKSWVKKRRSEVSKRKKARGKMGKPSILGGDGGEAVRDYFTGDTGKKRKKQFWE